MSYSNRDRYSHDSHYSSEHSSEYRREYDFKEKKSFKEKQSFKEQETELRCELCDRAVPVLTAHHLTPRQKTKRKNLDPGPTIQICSACHRQIHATYDNTYLARELNTLEKLQQDPKMQRFITWVRKQDPGKRVQVDRR